MAEINDKMQVIMANCTPIKNTTEYAIQLSIYFSIATGSNTSQLSNDFSYWKSRVVTTPTLSSLVALEVVIMTTSSATSDDRVVIWQLSIFNVP